MANRDDYIISKWVEDMLNQYRQGIITQLCECCNEWVNQMDLVWDLAEASEGEEDRLICLTCQKSKD